MLLGAALAVGLAAALYTATPHDALAGARPGLGHALYCGWMALLGEPQLTPPETWYLALVTGIYPLVGLVLVGDGLVRLGLLMLSRRRGEREWMKVMAST